MDKHEIEGYYWCTYKDMNIPMIVEIRFETWDHTRDGDRWALWDGDEEIPEWEWFKYNFIEKIKEPKFPYSRIEIKIPRRVDIDENSCHSRI